MTTVALAALVLAACGDPGLGSQRESPSSSLTDATQPSMSDAPVTAPPESLVDQVDTTASVPADGGGGSELERCADVDQITTDVVAERAQGNIDPVLNGVLLTYAGEHDDTFGGMWIDREALGTVVLAFTDDPTTHRGALAERSPSPDDVHAVEPPPDITDDRPIGEWGVAFDVVQVEHSEAELVDAIGPVMEAVQAATGTRVSGGVDPLRNRVSLDLSTPISPNDLVSITDAVRQLDGISSEMVCWSGLFVDEAPEPIEPGTPLDVIRVPDDGGTYPPDTPVTCDGVQFVLGDLQDLTPAADVESGLRSVLDDWLANGEGQFWPQEGWMLLYENNEQASFIHVGDDGVSFIGAEMGANGWIWAGAGGGQRCDVQLMLPEGLGPVEWVLDPQSPTPDASSTEIRVLATERGCASGEEMGDRLLGPQVVETPDAVRLAFAVIPRPGGQNCQGNPSTPVVVQLDAPLGERDILDGLTIAPITSLIDN